MKPILFNTEMVRAILDGRKTVTRRVIKPQPKGHVAFACMGSEHGTWGYPGKDTWKFWGEEYRLPETLTEEEADMRWTPPCLGGDILYVRETWTLQQGIYWHKAGLYVDGNGRDVHGTEVPQKWRPSIHMPKEAARLFLRVTDVRVDRLHNMTVADFQQEGVKREEARCAGCHCQWETENCLEKPCANRDAYEILCWEQPFRKMWNRTIDPQSIDLYGWNANPWVWVIEFERCEKPEED